MPDARLGPNFCGAKKRQEKTCDAIIGASIDRARRAEYEPGVVETAVKEDTRTKKAANSTYQQLRKVSQWNPMQS